MHVIVNCELTHNLERLCVDIRIWFCLFCLFEELMYYLMTMMLPRKQNHHYQHSGNFQHGQHLLTNVVFVSALTNNAAAVLFIFFE